MADCDLSVYGYLDCPSSLRGSDLVFIGWFTKCQGSDNKSTTSKSCGFPVEMMTNDVRFVVGRLHRVSFSAVINLA